MKDYCGKSSRTLDRNRKHSGMSNNLYNEGSLLYHPERHQAFESTAFSFFCTSWLNWQSCRKERQQQREVRWSPSGILRRRHRDRDKDRKKKAINESILLVLFSFSFFSTYPTAEMMTWQTSRSLLRTARFMVTPCAMPVVASRARTNTS